MKRHEVNRTGALVTGAAVVILAFALAAAPASAGPGDSPVPAPAPRTPPTGPSYTQGVPAITPGYAAGTLAPQLAQGVAKVSQADVVAYLASHGVPGLPDAGTAGHTVAKAQLLTSQQVAALVNEPTGVPDGTMLWFVTLKGSFVLSMPPSGDEAQGGSAVISGAYAVYDANTGNNIMDGGLPTGLQ